MARPCITRSNGISSKFQLRDVETYDIQRDPVVSYQINISHTRIINLDYNGWYECGTQNQIVDKMPIILTTPSMKQKLKFQNQLRGNGQSKKISEAIWNKIKQRLQSKPATRRPKPRWSILRNTPPGRPTPVDSTWERNFLIITVLIPLLLAVIIAIASAILVYRYYQKKLRLARYNAMIPTYIHVSEV